MDLLFCASVALADELRCMLGAADVSLCQGGCTDELDGSDRATVGVSALAASFVLDWMGALVAAVGVGWVAAAAC